MPAKFLQLLGTIIINIYIYFRFIKKHLPTVLYIYIFEDNYLFLNYYLLFLSIFFSIFSCYFVIQTTRVIFKIERIKKQSIFIKYLMKIIEFIKQTIKSLYELSAEKFSYEDIKKFCMYIYNIFKEKEKYIIFFFLGLPYIIIPLALLFDTLFFFTFKYFYKTLFLFTLPILYNMYLYILADIVSNIELLDEEINCTKITGSDEIKLEIKDGFNDETKKNIEKFDIPEYIDLYTLKIFMENLQTLEEYYKPWLLLFMYVIYTFCWTYIILFNLFTFSCLIIL